MSRRFGTAIVGAVVVILIVLVVTLLARQSVQKDFDKTSNDQSWDVVMSKNINQKTIKLKVDNRWITPTDGNIFMSEKMELMIPISVISDAFNCASNFYDNTKLVIQKGETEMTMNLNEATVDVNGTEYKTKEPLTKKKGVVYITASVFSKHLGYKYKFDGETNTAIMSDTAKTSALPDSYSYIEAEKKPTVKNQGNRGTCWAFATMTALESTLLPEEHYNFSVNHLVNYYKDISHIESGGVYEMSMAYLMGWKGPVLDKDDPYTGNKSPKNLKPVKHVQGAKILEKQDRETIKELVFKYGGVESSMYMDMDAINNESPYYRPSTYGYCYTGKSKPNHDVVVIGWDDHYPKENFQSSSVKKDGAYLCQNSWGDAFGNKGTFYVSYEDKRFGEVCVCYTDIENTDNYDNLYQCDQFGWTGTMGFDSSDTVYYSNIYKANGNENLKSVGLYAAAKNLDYEVFICDDYKNVQNLSERSHVASKGTFDEKGYYTLKLDKDYNLKKNSKFAIIVKITKEKREQTDKLIPVELQAKDMKVKVDLADGEGYISSDGFTWNSAEKLKCNLCVKAYTDRK